MSRLGRGLAHHPGVLWATLFTILGFFAGIEHSMTRAWIGAAIMSVFWIPVLLTAWSIGAAALEGEDDGE